LTQGRNDPESIIQIEDPEIDVETVMARIREGLAERALEQDVEFPTFAVTRARRGADPRFPEELYYQLEQANLNYDQAWVELSLIETELPLLGPFITRFKRELHQLVVFYVNRLGERQVTMNDALVRTLNELVESLEGEPAPEGLPHEAGEASSTQQQLAAMQQELAELRIRLERLEARQDKDA
jgi:hypothetical protein